MEMIRTKWPYTLNHWELKVLSLYFIAYSLWCAYTHLILSSLMYHCQGASGVKSFGDACLRSSPLLLRVIKYSKGKQHVTSFQKILIKN